MPEPYVVLHGGFHKTASTFLQKSLQRNQGKLAKAGVGYVSHRDLRKQFTVPCQQNAYQTIGIRRKTVITDEQLHQMAARFFAPILEDQPERLILSDENLAGHCGNCVKTGQLYRYRDAFMASFARETPAPVREIYLAVRNYADFFAGAYVEYIRSIQDDSTNMTSARHMCIRVFNHMPGWNGVINVVTKHFPDAQIYVWKFEDFVAAHDMASEVLQRLVGSATQVKDFKDPTGNSQRASASQRAMDALQRIAALEGIPAMVAARKDIQEAYPRNAENGRFDPWEAWERAHLLRLYDQDIARLQTNRHVTLLSP